MASQQLRVLLLTAGLSGLAWPMAYGQVVPPQPPTLRVPGGIVAVSRAVGLRGAQPTHRFMLELIRWIHGRGRGASREGLRRLAFVVDTARRVEVLSQSLAASNDGVSLRRADTAPGRLALDAFAHLVGATPRVDAHGSALVLSDADGASARRDALQLMGLDADALVARVNRGETVYVPVETDRVPLFVEPQIWRERIFREAIAADDLFAAIVLDYDTALLYYGLASLDPVTRLVVAGDAALVQDIRARSSAVFGSFGRALRVRDGRVEPPGGPEATRLWEALVGIPVTELDRFIRAILTRDDGRLAYFYDSMAQLPPLTASAIFGAAQRDAGQRGLLTRVYGVFKQVEPSWSPTRSPFARPAYDPAWVLTLTAITPDGRLVGPAWPGFWATAFGREHPRDSARRGPSAIGDDLVSWLAAICDADATTRRTRFGMFRFAQRVFPAAEADDAVAIGAAVRGYATSPSLMLTFERMGVTDPALYARGAELANRLSNIRDERYANIALRQFQAALAILERAHFTKSIDAPAATALVASLVDVTLSPDGRYEGRVAQWLAREAVPTLASPFEPPESEATAERVVLAALAGRPCDSPSAPPCPTLTWESFSYRLDVRQARWARLVEIRDRHDTWARTLDDALALAQIGVDVAAAPPTTDARRDLGARIETLGRSLGDHSPPVTSWLSHPQRTLGPVAWALARPDVEQASSALVRTLSDVADALLAERLTVLAYVAHLGEPGNTAVLAGDIPQRHDLGIGSQPAVDGHQHQGPWSLPTIVSRPGVPWHVQGSLLGLDLGLASLALRYAAGFPTMATEPALHEDDAQTFAETVVLLNPADLTDASRDRLLAAIARGRERLEDLRHDPSGPSVDALAGRAGFSAWRREALRWSVAAHSSDVDDHFSLSDLARLGWPDGASDAIGDAWGSAARPLDGCLCTRFSLNGAWEDLAYRAGTGERAARLSDLTLRVAEVLADANLPAALTPAVLAYVTFRFLHDTQPANGDDWWTLAHEIREIPREAILDYVVLLTNGPLYPITLDAPP